MAVAKKTITKTEESKKVEKDIEPIREVVEKKSHNSLQELYAEVRAKAFKKKVVTISYNDVRDNAETTSIYLTCENQYFAISRFIPLNIPVEIEQCLIDVAGEATFLSHVPEVINGKRTGNSTYRQLKKYNINFE